MYNVCNNYRTGHEHQFYYPLRIFSATKQRNGNIISKKIVESFLKLKILDSCFAKIVNL